MIDQATNLAVSKTVTVEAPQQRAFNVFTEGFSRWWPLDSHHIGEQEPRAVIMEPQSGGRWFELAPNGTETEWGRVLEWEPPGRVLLAWHLGPEWAYDPDPAKSTEIEVLFVPEGESTTRVELVHRGFEVHGDRANELREPVDSENGWQGLLQLYAAEAAKAE